MKITLVTNYDDWEGIYFDDICIGQGHRIRMEFVLDQLIAKTVTGFETIEVDNEWLYEESGGYLPFGLSDVKFKEEN